MTARLRETNRQRTREAIQRAALDLMEEQGFSATTIEHIAERGGVSPATYFRYFPTKEAAVIDDRFDELFTEAPDPPADATALQAVAAIYRSVFAQLEKAVRAGSPEARDWKRRMQLIRTEPSLRAAVHDRRTKACDETATLVATQSGRKPSDLEVRVTAGAAMEAVNAATDLWIERDCKGSLTRQLDRAIAHLESGLRT